MMRLLVLGSSQAAALALGRDAFTAIAPATELTFFALPGASWSRTRIDEAGRLGPAPDDRFGLRKAAEWNGCERIGLQGFDHIAVSAARFHLYYLARLMRAVDIHGLPATGALPRISRAMLSDTLAAWVREDLAALRTRLPVGVPVTMIAVPYPLAATDRPGPSAEPGLARLRRHPAAPEIERDYDAAVAGVLSAAGIGWMAQPDATRAGPFATDDGFARPGALEAEKPDLRHVGADYGRMVMAALARRLGGAPPGSLADIGPGPLPGPLSKPLSATAGPP
ncbi:hypothetical protein [Frigidibacter sp. MR17.24]|uniref:hypothetical protein n=1 Tax=Frigidibacter sp. MR17.24 TaxID=3127345 RepID=UPI003012D2EB